MSSKQIEINGTRYPIDTGWKTVDRFEEETGKSFISVIGGTVHPLLSDLAKVIYIGIDEGYASKGKEFKKSIDQLKEQIRQDPDTLAEVVKIYSKFYQGKKSEAQMDPDPEQKTAKD